MDALGNLARKLTRNARDTEDLVQECMLKALQNFHRFEPGTNCKAWLFTILKNTFINDYRRKVRGPRKVELNENLHGDPVRRHVPLPCLASVSKPAFREMLDDDVTHALDKLPDEFRRTLLLSSVDDLSYREIAGLLGVPLGTVMSRLHRGRAIMRESLHNYALDEGIMRSGSSGAKPASIQERPGGPDSAAE